MKFSYKCVQGHLFEVDARPNTAERTRLCDCGHNATRDFAADWSSQTVNTGDPYRAYHLSTAKSKAAGEQQRPIGGPTDNFERRREEQVRGIQFVGNDTSGMSAAARRGIERARSSK